MFELGFGVADLARTRFSISPMFHLVSGVASAEHGCVGASLGRDRWWRRVRRHVPNRAAPLLDLVNAGYGEVPEFLHAGVTSGRPGITDELDAMLVVPERIIRRDLAYADRKQEPPRVVAELRDGDTRRLRRIADGAWSLFQACIAPDWPDMQRLLGADIAHHSRTAAEEGLGTMLARLHPGLSWQEEGALQYPTPPEQDRSFALDGRGLLLRPSVFLQHLALIVDEHHLPTLMYPSSVRPSDHRPDRRTDGLADLIGPARTRALHAIAQGPCTTAQLAERLGVTSPSASVHATALRKAGVITTEREGRQVRHDLTELGRDLLNGAG